MSVQKPTRIETFEQLNMFVQDLYNNLGTDDLRPSGIRTEAPTVATLNKGRQAIVEIDGVPYVYYKTTSDALYRIPMTAV